MAKLPFPLQDLIDQLARLPGLGPKSALRLAMTLLVWPDGDTRRLGRSILELRDRLHVCSMCGAVADSDPCSICKDPDRQEDLLCVVPEWDSLLAMEAGGFFRGRYCILGGLLSPLDNMDGGKLRLERLLDRLKTGHVREVVLALGATVEAENTATFLRGLIRKYAPGVRVSRLAQGIPLGAEVKFMDHETLRQSLQFRQPL